MDKVIENKDTNVEDTIKMFDKIHDKIKYKAFGKVTITDKNKKHKQNEKETNKSTKSTNIYKT